mgnify:CR=1 FL=1
MKLKLVPTAAALAASLMMGAALASGGASGPTVQVEVQGKIGEVIVNPYNIAPLTAVIRNGGYVIEDAHVRVVPKKGGQEIAYDVNNAELKTHAGIPVFGLYPDYANQVEVSYTRIFQGKKEQFKETYTIRTAPVYMEMNGSVNTKSAFLDVDVKHVDKKYGDRLYLVNNLVPKPPKASRAVWNNPTGGALEWSYGPQNGIVDTKGEVRWYLLPNLDMYDPESIYKSGIMMGFQQGADGLLTWGYGQRYVKYDLMGREVFNRRLPANYSDFSHALDRAQNGHYFIRAASADLRRADNKRVHTVRDVIIEVDQNGNVVDDWRLMEILDPYREDVIKTLDQGAVCLNIDASKAGQTMSAEELAKQEASDTFGDITGVGAGRNWAHVNSVDYDPTDDSIIISSRHQSAVVKIGRDKKVKWILAAPQGWKDQFKDKLLTPVDKNGKPLKCTEVACEGGFDWTWTQHTAWRIDEKSDENVIFITVFDNGDARGMEQPALQDDKYTRGVIYRIDQKKGTVEQVWEVGKDLGHAAFSPVTGLCQYQPDKNSVVVFYSTAGLSFDLHAGGGAMDANMPQPHIAEYRWGETDPAVKITLKDAFGYQAFPVSVEKAFSKN